MTPNMLRALWSLIESSQPKLLQELDDCSLVNWLVNQMDSRTVSTVPNSQELRTIETYVREHIQLIRDIADGSSHQEKRLEAVASY